MNIAHKSAAEEYYRARVFIQNYKMTNIMTCDMLQSIDFALQWKYIHNNKPANEGKSVTKRTGQ